MKFWQKVYVIKSVIMRGEWVVKIPGLCKYRYEAEILPPFCYGFAYEEYISDRMVFAIMPLNFIIRGIRYIHFKWRRFQIQGYTTKDYIREQVRKRSDVKAEHISNRRFLVEKPIRITCQFCFTDWYHNESGYYCPECGMSYPTDYCNLYASWLGRVDSGKFQKGDAFLLLLDLRVLIEEYETLKEIYFTTIDK